jgi:hypothetical protein
VYRSVFFAVLDEARVVLGKLTPFRVAGLLVNEPELAAEEAFAPVRLGLTGMLPPPARGVHWEIIGVGLDEAAQLFLSEGDRRLASGYEWSRFGHEGASGPSGCWDSQRHSRGGIVWAAAPRVNSCAALATPL